MTLPALSVKARLTALCLALIVIMGGANLLLTTLVQNNQRAMQELNAQYERLAILQSTERALMSLRHNGSRVNSARLARNAVSEAQARVDLELSRQEVLRQLERVAVFNEISANAVRNALEVALPLQDRVVTAILEGKLEVVEAGTAKHQRYMDITDTELRSVGERESVRADELYRQEQLRADRATHTAALVLAGATIMALLAMWVMIGSIIRPLHAITVAIRKVNHGQTDIVMPPVTADEFGDVAVALRQFRDQADYLRKLAYEDTLTGLGNRARFEAALQDAIERCQGGHERLAVLHFDLDQFRAVNDRLGYHDGDRFLVEAATRLQRYIPSSALLCRFIGDHFVLMIEGLPVDKLLDPRLREIANIALRGLGEPYRVGNDLLNMSASIGIAIYPSDGSTVQQLLSAAGAASHAAKKNGRNSLCFAASEVAGDFRRRLGMPSDIRRGVESGEFVPYYQPIINVATGAVVGAEALLRWRHPEHGLLLPSAFIETAEEAGLINRLGEACLVAVHDHCVQWRRQGRRYRISVNLSPRQVQSGHILELLRRLDVDSDRETRQLQFELTESALLDSREGASSVLHEVRRMGYQVGLDDFGTGYSSLSYLHSLPINRLKVDQHLVQRAVETREAAAVVTAIIALGNSLQLEVVAEGVETAEQMRLLSQLGCRIQQGFYFARAMPAEELAPWVDAYEGVTLVRPG